VEVDEQKRIFGEFIEQNYHPQLLEAVRKGQSHLILDFFELIKFNSELSEELLESPEEVIKAGELSIKEYGSLPTKIDKFNLRFTNFPKSQKIKISDIRSKHLNKLIFVEGIVRRKTEVRPHVTIARFECPNCTQPITIFQLEKRFKEPTRCGNCRKKGKFKEISKEFIDAQSQVLEESPDDLEGNQPKRITVLLRDDLASPLSEKNSSPGAKVGIIGLVNEVPITLRSGGKSTRYDLIIECNNIIPVDDVLEDIKINDIIIAFINCL